MINAVSARAGGGINDLVHTLPLLRERLQGRIRVYVAAEGESALRAAGDSMDGVECVRISSPFRRAKWELWDLPRIVKRDRPAAVFQFSNLIFRSLPVPQITVLRSPTFFSPEYASQARRGVYQKLRYRIGCSLSRKTIARAAAVFCISQTQKDDIVRAYGSMGEKVRVSHLGVEPTHRLQGRPVNRAEAIALLPQALRNRLGSSLDGASHILLNVAHYYQHKNFLTLLNAVDLLAKSDPSIRAIVTGGLVNYGGPLGDRERQETDLARSLAGRGILVDLGPIPKEWVYPLMHMADAFVFPSSLESFGHPLLEAMATGVPVIASDTPVHREIAGGAAAYFQTYDAEALQHTLRRVLDDGEWRHRLIDEGHRNVHHFSWSAHVDNLVEAIVGIARGVDAK